jgi:hypothetical protein
VSGNGGHLKIPESVKHLDPDVVFDFLACHAGNVSAAADDLGVPSGDFRRWLWSHPRMSADFDERQERHLDLVQQNILGACQSEDPRLRFAASCFSARYMARAAKRGWITTATDAESIAAAAQPQRIQIGWAEPGGVEYVEPSEPIVRDGVAVQVPVYSNGASTIVDPPAGDSAKLVEEQPAALIAEPLTAEQLEQARQKLRAFPHDREALLATIRGNGYSTDGL